MSRTQDSQRWGHSLETFEPVRHNAIVPQSWVYVEMALVAQPEERREGEYKLHDLQLQVGGFNSRQDNSPHTVLSSRYSNPRHLSRKK